MIALLAASWLLVADPVMLSTRGSIDPTLPDVLRPTVVAAIETELDPKRGPDNALAMLKAAEDAHKGQPELQLSLRLRAAAVFLRQQFLLNPRESMAERYQRAMTTFAQLDLTEPGFSAWLARTLKEAPRAEAMMAKAKQLDVALLIRGSVITRKAAKAAIESAFADTSFKLNWVPAKKAHFLLKVAMNPGQAPGRLRVELAIEDIHDGKTVWQDRSYREAEAQKPETAALEGLRWVVRIGGRNMLFRWIGHQGLPGLVAKRGGHEHHHHPHNAPAPRRARPSQLEAPMRIAPPKPGQGPARGITPATRSPR